MNLQEKISKITAINSTIIELKKEPQTPKTKLRIQKLQQEIDKITMS